MTRTVPSGGRLAMTLALLIAPAGVQAAEPAEIVELADLRRAHEMLTDVLAWMKRELAAGTTLEELRDLPLPSPAASAG